MRGSIHRYPAVLAIVCTGALAACSGDALQGAASEVTDTPIKLDLPPVPTFDPPTSNEDGTFSVRAMRLKGRKLFETELTIRGYVTWIYDCAAEVRKPEQSEKEVRKMLEEDPALCNRPHFFLGDTPDTKPERSIWVVEVPRPLRRDERRTMSRSERAALPPVPKVELGDQVNVTGTWNQSSPKGFFNSDGLLVYKELETLSWASDEQ